MPSHNGVVLGPASPLVGVPKRPRRKSAQIENKVVVPKGDELMALHGFRSIHFSQARATMQTPGIPDRKYYHRGRRLACWWEAKAEGGVQSEAQRQFQLDAEACGEVYLLGGVEALVQWLKRTRFVRQDSLRPR